MRFSQKFWAITFISSVVSLHSASSKMADVPPPPHPNHVPEQVEQTSGFWFVEAVTPSMDVRVKLKKIMHESQSEFQKIQVIDTHSFGRTLVLDSKTQSAQLDEFIYHECLVHPAMVLHGNPKTVFIGGGGELATAREVLKHNTVEKVVMADLDQGVVDVSKAMLPEWNAGASEDPRFELRIGDAHACLKDNPEETYDVIIMDIADPIEAGPGYVLYTEEFYEYAQTKLNPGGVLVTQSGPGSITCYHECFTAIHNTLRQKFAHVAPYTVDIPSFGCQWAFNVAFNRVPEARSAAEVLYMGQKIDDALTARCTGGELRFYDGTAHAGIFGLPKYLRKYLEDDTRVITVDNPVFMY
mmetsp:Transcript_25027/g.39578  ORF Transcript_25027/g.39578 Transcript_25027/m.39578 type:complete len:355 (-) Transcript_25027:1269-2333(-)